MGVKEKLLIGGGLAAGLAGAYYLGNPENRRYLKDNALYGKYVLTHKKNIINPMIQLKLPLTQALKHDMSKIGPQEWPAYRDWFQGAKGMHGSNDPETLQKFRTAADHHRQSPKNMHHWYKVGRDPKSVPMNYKLESVADWYSVQKTNKRTNEPFKKWVAKRIDKFPLEPDVKAEVTNRLGISMTKKAEKIVEKLMSKEAVSSQKILQALKNRMYSAFDTYYTRGTLAQHDKQLTNISNLTKDDRVKKLVLMARDVPHYLPEMQPTLFKELHTSLDAALAKKASLQKQALSPATYERALANRVNEVVNLNTGLNSMERQMFAPKFDMGLRNKLYEYLQKRTNRTRNQAVNIYNSHYHWKVPSGRVNADDSHRIEEAALKARYDLGL